MDISNTHILEICKKNNVRYIMNFSKKYPNQVLELFYCYLYSNNNPSLFLLNELLQTLDMNRITRNTCNPIVYAYHIKRYDIVELLLKYGFSLDYNECNVLQDAIENNDERYVIKFLENGCSKKNYVNVNLYDKTNNKQIQKALLHYGFRIPKKSEKLVKQLKNIPLIRSIDYTYPNIEELLYKSEKHGQMDVNDTNDDDSEYSSSDNDYVTDVYYDNSITLKYPNNQYSVLCTRYWETDLFRLKGETWHSVEQYMYYRYYKDEQTKASLIKSISTNKQMEQFRQLETSSAVSATCICNTHDVHLEFNEKQIRTILENKKIMIPTTFHSEFKEATLQKFLQNKSLKMKLLNTHDTYLINKDIYDRFGYTSNLLGDILMGLRHQFGGYENTDIIKTNNIEYHVYQANPKFYIVRGNPDSDIAQEIRTLGNFKNKNGTITRGKYCKKLRGGPGWLVPKTNKSKLEQVLQKTHPLSVQVSYIGKKWLKHKITRIISIADKIRNADNKNEITQRILYFVLKDIFQSEHLLSPHKKRFPLSFTIYICEIINEYMNMINKSTQEMLWEYLERLFYSTFSQDSSAMDMKETIEAVNDIFYKTIDILEQEQIDIDISIELFLRCFNRLYPILYSMLQDENKTCVTLIDILIGEEHYKKVRSLFKQKIKQDKKGKYEDELVMYQERFDINIHFLKDIIRRTPPKLEKKCKLMLLTTFEYLENITNEREKQDLLKNLFIMM